MAAAQQPQALPSPEIIDRRVNNLHKRLEEIERNTPRQQQTGSSPDVQQSRPQQPWSDLPLGYQGRWVTDENGNTYLDYRRPAKKGKIPVGKIGYTFGAFGVFGILGMLIFLIANRPNIPEVIEIEKPVEVQVEKIVPVPVEVPIDPLTDSAYKILLDIYNSHEIATGVWWRIEIDRRNIIFNTLVSAGLVKKESIPKASKKSE